MKKARREIEAKRARLDALRRVLRLPHTVAQLAARFGVEPATIAKDLAAIRPWIDKIDAEDREEPPTYRLKNWRDSHDLDLEVRCDCGAVWRGGVVVAGGAAIIAIHAKRATCHVHEPTARTDRLYRRVHQHCGSVAHAIDALART